MKSFVRVPLTSFFVRPLRGGVGRTPPPRIPGYASGDSIAEPVAGTGGRGGELEPPPPTGVREREKRGFLHGMRLRVTNFL